MPILFSNICRFLFLKLKMLSTPKIPNTKQAIFTSGALEKMSTSCADIKRKMEATTAKNIQTLCILCNISVAKLAIFFAIIKK